ncbi:transcriptional repressor scratch 1 [Elysia marginata]|uniref:Transcriptional repressor scratch 1 n=1 Tax=Elysia marginata TaxID=1093978 RepID=A0AAV4GPL3_9GAST|nr:transcriptional repressor scratch 1 [Elysia marginata]
MNAMWAQGREDVLLWVRIELDSPPFKKREFFNRGARLQDSKSNSISDGAESDSGCSSHNESRHESSSAETEYGWDCPSGLSLLLELMAQSPQRYMGRDAIGDHLGLAEIARSAGKGAIAIAGRQFGHTLEPIDEISAMKLDSREDYVVKETQRNGLLYSKESTESTTELTKEDGQPTPHEVGTRSADMYRKSYLQSLSHEVSHATSVTTYPPEHIQGANALYDLSTINSSKGANFTQRKINFEERPYFDLRYSGEDYITARCESPPDQPIDYSQLSSRSKERNEASESSKETSKIEIESTGKWLKDAVKSEDIADTHQYGKSEMEGSGKLPQYEFILSPKMDRNGNIILSQASAHNVPIKTANNIAEVYREIKPASLTAHHTDPTRDAYADSLGCHHSPSFKSGNSPPIHLSDVYLEDSASNLAQLDGAANARQSRPETFSNNSIYRGKSLGVYHPKLKYLLAATQVAKRKAEEEEEAAKHDHKIGHLTSSAEKSHLKSREENVLSSRVEFNWRKSSLESHDGSKSSKQELQFYNSGSYPIPAPQNQLSVISNMQKAKMFTMGHETLSISNNIHLPGRSDAGVTNNGNAFSHPHPHQPYQPHNVFQFEFSTTSAMLPDFQISNIHKGSEHNILSPLEAKILAPPSSDPPRLSPHHFQHQQQMPTTSCTEHTSSGKNTFTSLSSSSLSPTSPVEASSQILRSGLDPYECSECGKRYSTSSNLARHRQTHRSVCDKKARKCPHCDKVYVSMPAYSMHVRTHNQGCQCPHCGKKFSRPWLLQGHIRTHTGEKPFSCHQCGKSFADKSNLRAHIQTHSTEKPYVCGRCGKAFALKSYLYKHEESSCMRGQRFNRR